MIAVACEQLRNICTYFCYILIINYTILFSTKPQLSLNLNRKKYDQKAYRTPTGILLFTSETNFLKLKYNTIVSTTFSTWMEMRILCCVCRTNLQNPYSIFYFQNAIFFCVHCFVHSKSNNKFNQSFFFLDFYIILKLRRCVHCQIFHCSIYSIKEAIA